MQAVFSVFGESNFKRHHPGPQTSVLGNGCQCSLKFSQPRVNTVWHKCPHLSFELEVIVSSEMDHVTFFNVSNDNICHKLLPLGPKTQSRKVKAILWGECMREMWIALDCP